MVPTVPDSVTLPDPPLDAPLSPSPAETQRTVTEVPPLGDGMLGLATAVLRSPAALLARLETDRRVLRGLAWLVLATMALTGVLVGAFSGGLQWLVAPLKIGAGTLLAAALCLPSLYVFSSLAGGRQSVRETWGALLMGLALIGVLLLALAPVVWLFGQTTSSPAVIGGLHLAVLLVSCWFGLGLVGRTFGEFHHRAWSGFRLWSVVFVLVILQLTTTLRPLVGPFEGWHLEPRMFFLQHWAEAWRSQ